MALAGRLGANLEIDVEDVFTYLFSESAPRYLVEMESDRVEAELEGLPFKVLGHCVAEPDVVFRCGNGTLPDIRLSLDDLTRAFKVLL